MEHMQGPKGLVFELVPSMNQDLSSVDKIIEDILNRY
jgi:hypothetical protein